MALDNVHDLERFAVGDLVVWSECGCSEQELLLNRHGPGPFTVTKTENVPQKSISNVGHAQWISVSNADGEQLSDGFNEKFSGWYFRKS